jgi:histone H3/H4
MELKVDGFREEQVVTAVAEMVRDQMSGRIDEAVRGAIKGALEEQVRALVNDAIRPVLATVLDEGWQPTDQWGEPKGPKVTLRDRIGKAVSAFLDVRDGYDRQTAAEKVIKEEIEKAVRGDAGKELKRASEALRAQVDAVLQAKLRESLSSALGLRGA